MCSEPIEGLLYLVSGSRKHGRRWSSGQFGICTSCFTTGGPDPKTGLTKLASLREAKDFRWEDLVGRGKPLPAAQCAGCDRLVVRAADPLLKRVTCSRTCSTSLTRTRNGNQGSEDPCQGCGKPITTGRADARFCGSACRQKAYRRRRASPAAAVVVAPPSIAPRRQAAAKNFTRGVQGLQGLATAFEAAPLDDSVSQEQAQQWAADITECITALKAAAAKLRRHAQQQ
ncbi:hypothetical protein [Streptacidiphilus sp. PAMC 29251]